MAGKRITELTESAALIAGDYFAIDNAAYTEAKKIKFPLGTKVISLSGRDILSDSVLTLTGGATGTDQSEDIQAILDEAETAPILVLWDCAVTAANLSIYSNTTIIALEGCGAITPDNANAPIFRNANLSNSTRTDVDIWIDGGIWNGNAANQDHDQAPTADAPWGWTPGMCFFCGVERLTLSNLTIYKPRTFSVWILNWVNVTCENIIINVGVAGGQNYDGLHFNGPGRYLTVHNLDAITYDDALALNADEPTGSDDLPNWTTLYTGGDMTDVLADGIRFGEDCAFGIRVLSGGSRVDQITLRNISGATSRQLVLIDCYAQENDAVDPPGTGNVGTIIIDGMTADLTEGGYKNCYVYINLVAENIVIRNVTRDISSTTYPTVLVGDSNANTNYADITNLTIDGLSSYENVVATEQARQLLVYGRVANLNFRNAQVVGGNVGGQGGPIIELGSVAECEVDSLDITNLTGHGYSNAVLIGTLARVRGMTVSGSRLEYAGGGEVVDNNSLGIARLKLSGVRAGYLYSGTFGEVAGDSTTNISFTNLLTSLNAHWTFNNTLTDSSGNGRTLTAGGTAALTYPSGLRGQMVYLDMVHNQHAYINPASWMNAGVGGLTVAGFFYPLDTGDVGNQYQFLVAFGSGTAIEYALVYDTFGNRFLAYASSDGLIGTLVNVEIGSCLPDKWYHVALRWSSANGLGIWVNGAQASTALASMWSGNSTVLAIGVNSTGTQPFYGYVSQVTHWATRQSDANLLLHENYMSGPTATF